MRPKASRLDDEQVRRYICDGVLVLDSGLEREVHQQIFDKLEWNAEHEFYMGNNVLPRIAELQQILDAGGTPNSYHVARSMIDLGRTQDAIDIVEDLPENLQSIHISAVFGYLATTDEASVDYLDTLDDRHIASGAIALLADEETAGLYRQEILDSIPDPEQRQRIAQMAIGSIRLDR